MVKMHPMFKTSIPSGLSKSQKELFDKLANKGYQLFCNEGEKYRCWVEKGSQKIYVDNRTVNALSNKGYLLPDDSYQNDKIAKFRMKLNTRL
jgi:hypothetical protein